MTGEPDIAVGESLLDYGWHYLGTTASRTLVVSNVGTDLLTVSSMVSRHADFAPDTTSFTLAPGMSRNVVVTFAPTSPGAVSAMLSIHSDDPDEGVVTVELRGEGVSPPVIAVAPASLYSELLTNQTTTRAVTIDNIAGGSELVWALSLNPGAGWLHASPTSGTLPAGSSAAVTVSFDAKMA